MPLCHCDLCRDVAMGVNGPGWASMFNVGLSQFIGPKFEDAQGTMRLADFRYGCDQRRVNLNWGTGPLWRKNWVRRARA